VKATMEGFTCFFLRFHPLSPYSSMFQLQGETGETYESKVHVILMQISN